MAEEGECVSRIGLRDPLPDGTDTDELDTPELGIEVVEPAPPWARFDTRLEALAGSMVVVVGGKLAVEPGARIIVTVTVPPLSLGEVELPLPFEVVSPPTPVAAIRDRAFDSLVHAINYSKKHRYQ